MNPCVDARAIREQLSLTEEADVHSPVFLRFIVRLSEALNHDIPTEHYGELTTLPGCREYMMRLLDGANAAQP